LLRGLRLLGVELVLTRGKIQARAPHGILTRQLREELAAHKEEMAFLLRLEGQ
jgi:hypothetical protein